MRAISRVIAAVVTAAAVASPPARARVAHRLMPGGRP
jgi:hypothetical protein